MIKKKYRRHKIKHRTCPSYCYWYPTNPFEYFYLKERSKTDKKLRKNPRINNCWIVT